MCHTLAINAIEMVLFAVPGGGLTQATSTRLHTPLACRFSPAGAVRAGSRATPALCAVKLARYFTTVPVTAFTNAAYPFLVVPHITYQTGAG